MRSEQLSKRFLVDLQAVASLEVERTLSLRFLEDLRIVYEAAEDSHASVADAALSFVANHLQDWRSHKQNELRSVLGRLREDDPLRCPISLFGTMDYGRLETAHTRTLAWLLNPKKEHGFGSKLLEALLLRVEGKRLPIDVEEVASEYLIDDPTIAGRIDVLARGHWIEKSGHRIPWILVIEAKIEAWEGAEQLSRYEEWLRGDDSGENREVFRVFLTPDARQAATARQDWTLLRFQELVEAFRDVLDQLRDKPGYHYLRFYIAGVLRDVCRWHISGSGSCPIPS
jgi:PD-(D/E)XK nuclease superfamily protein